MQNTVTNLPADGSSASTLTITVKDAGGAAVAGTAVNLSQAGGGAVSFSAAAGTTDASGVFTTTVRGAGPGDVTVTITAVGETQTVAYTVAPAAATFAITSPASDTITRSLGDTLTVTVSAPTSAEVVFATTIGTWENAQSTIRKTVVGGTVSAIFSSATDAGIANIQVYDPANPTTASDSLTVAVTSATASSITIQASPTVVPISSGGVNGVSTLLVTVRDSAGNPVGGAPVSFKILNPTGGGETISPVVQLTAATPSAGLALGQARVTFTAGSLPSGQTGVQIRASVVDTAVATGTSPSGNDGAVVIGGLAGSVVIGTPTTIQEDATTSQYILPMSVLVADSNGNAVSGATVSLKIWPIGWSTGQACGFEADDGVSSGTFFNEDANENLILDAGEDGTRNYFAGGTAIGAATKDTLLTPTNSAAGALPATVVTNANGVQTFNLTYLKSNSIWTIARVRASTLVQGTETVGEVQFRLAPLEKDVTPVCRIGNSPYKF